MHQKLIVQYVYECIANIPLQPTDELYGQDIYQANDYIQLQHCDEKRFQTLACVHYTIFSVVKLDLFIQALLLDHILALAENYAYAYRASYYIII